ncbi:hypothetical protein FQV39_06625 [Bosea sp. F3-2]|uniref:hypothetical protein n=1 Tax=Bosea sp. F3-2 TaxID=2599640 RepID=UPI0011F01D7D|nr:hypothetical protein [Bosea sp. F3-2]QEL22276.1 hypothetical protein FQV39_06625 [Bosea sp. F3-2]
MTLSPRKSALEFLDFGLTKKLVAATGEEDQELCSLFELFGRVNSVWYARVMSRVARFERERQPPAFGIVSVAGVDLRPSNMAPKPTMR